MSRVFQAALAPVGFQTISLSNSTAVALNSTCRKADAFDVSVETQAARFRMDSTAPTMTTGVLLAKDNLYRFENFNGTSLLRFQRSTGTCTLSIMAYQYRGSVK